MIGKRVSGQCSGGGTSTRKSSLTRSGRGRGGSRGVSDRWNRAGTGGRLVGVVAILFIARIGLDMCRVGSARKYTCGIGWTGIGYH